ncbi:MAG: GNAT family N-acetyltransferase [Pyrinomonadaceae bacterium]|nr:GNAT family N-acetyltransferase [Pyrinomonadaceae bacterium]
MIEVRESTDLDVTGIRDLFIAAYGKNYTYPAYYDLHVLKKMVFDDDTLLLVAVETDTGQILGTASVIFDLGEYGDLVGEFGRLVVHPEGRHKGIGKKLMEKRLEVASQRLHVGFVENRVAHPFSQKISARFGFAPAGFLPLKARFDERESLALYVRHFGDAITLRRNNPRLIPECFELAQYVLSSCGLEADAIIDDSSKPYPDEKEFELEEMKTKGYASLIRFERSRSDKKEIFGPARIHQGIFRLTATHSHYVIARKNGALVGAVGFSIDMVEKAVKIFELVTLNEMPNRVLVEEVMRICREKYEMAYIEVDVSAYSPRMQRTLLELQFVPVAYIPAFAFKGSERCDVVRMARLFRPAELDAAVRYKKTEPIFEIVKNSFAAGDIFPELAEALPGIRLFKRLSIEQARRLMEICEVKSFEKGQTVVETGMAGENAFVILSGEFEVKAGMNDRVRSLGKILKGECFGETAILTTEDHSVCAIASEKTEAAVINSDDLDLLIRRRPDIGVVLYRNLARSLGRKLRSVDADIASTLFGEDHQE